ncbi:MAG: ABC transporter permease [archaeon]
MGVIYVLWIRQLKRYLRSKTRIIGSLGQPLLFLIALGFGFGPIYAKAGGGDYIQFLAPGIIAMSIIFTATFMGIEIIWDRQFGFLKETLVAPVSRFKIMIGRTLGGATVAVLQGVVVLLLSLLAGFRPVDIWMLPLALVFMALIALMFTAFGTALASRMEDMHGFQLIINFLIMPLFFLSGAIFPLNSGVPKAIDIVAKLNPLTYGVDGLRDTLVFSVNTGTAFNLIVLSAVTLVFLLIGSFLFSKLQV